MGVFQGVDHKYVVSWNFNKQLFWNGNWEAFEMGFVILCIP